MFKTFTFIILTLTVTNQTDYRQAHDIIHYMRMAHFAAEATKE